MTAFREVGSTGNARDQVRDEKQQGALLLGSLLQQSVEKLNGLVQSDKAIKKN